MNFSTFWNKNKVFILGLLSGIAIVLQDALGTNVFEWKSIAVAAGITVLSFLAKQWRGQGLSILGILGVASDTVYQLYTTGTLQWERALLTFLVAIIAAAGADPKSRGYEQTDTIKAAKAEGEAITPASLTAKPKI